MINWGLWTKIRPRIRQHLTIAWKPSCNKYQQNWCTGKEESQVVCWQETKRKNLRLRKEKRLSSISLRKSSPRIAPAISNGKWQVRWPRRTLEHFYILKQEAWKCLLWVGCVCEISNRYFTKASFEKLENFMFLRYHSTLKWVPSIQAIPPILINEPGPWRFSKKGNSRSEA